jgi:hypothetical protein
MDDSKKDEKIEAKRPAEEPGAERDLSFLWPAIDRIRSVEIKFTADAASDAAGSSVAADTETRLATLEAEVAALKEIVRNAAGLPAGAEAAPAEPGTTQFAPSEYPRHSPKGIVTVIAAAVGLLLLAHWLIVVVYDLRTVTLLLASIAIPFGIAILFTRWRRISLKCEIAIALIVGLVAVFGMSYVTSVVEETSFLPANAREWRETLEYVASITFAYLTGVLVSSAWQARIGTDSGRVGQTTLRVAHTLVKATGQALGTGAAAGRHVKGIQDLINFAIPAATAIASVTTGVSSILK